MCTWRPPARIFAARTATPSRTTGSPAGVRIFGRPTRTALLECTNCHADMATPDGHEGSTIDRHLARVACQTCHIPATPRTPPTRRHRGHRDPPDVARHPQHRAALPPGRESQRPDPGLPVLESAQPQLPLARRRPRSIPATGRYPTSRPDRTRLRLRTAKLYAFKYKTAEQPITNVHHQLIALDTAVFFATADAGSRHRAGSCQHGLSAAEPYSWIETDTFQMLNHQVSPDGSALRCNDCHGSNRPAWIFRPISVTGSGMTESTICFQCHGAEEDKSFEEIHDKHVKDKGYRLLLVPRIRPPGARAHTVGPDLLRRLRKRHRRLVAMRC